MNEKEQPSAEDKKSNIPGGTDFPADHPGLQEIAQNPNPRANENITDSEADTKDSADEKVGSEITDGEGG